MELRKLWRTTSVQVYFKSPMECLLLVYLPLLFLQFIFAVYFCSLLLHFAAFFCHSLVRSDTQCYAFLPATSQCHSAYSEIGDLPKYVTIS